MRALIIEDDPETVESLSLTLQTRWPNLEVCHAPSGEEGVEMAEYKNPDFIILDLVLPGISGFEVLKRIRRFSSVPLIVLTVKRDETDVFKGLELGADDYLTKPCGQSEFLARVDARMRDSNRHPETLPLSFGPLRFDPATRTVVCGEREIRLTAIESRLLHHLMKNAGHVATYDALVCDIWGDDFPEAINSLRVHIRYLREKIEWNPSRPRLIPNWPGVGYSLAIPAERPCPEGIVPVGEANQEEIECARPL